MPVASHTTANSSQVALNGGDLNFAPRFRPFYAREVSDYERQLDTLVLPGDFRALTDPPRLVLSACRLRAGGLVVNMEATPISVRHTVEHAAATQSAEFLASFVLSGHGVILQGGMTLPLEPGDIIFRTTALPSELRMLTDSKMVVLRGPLSRLLGAYSSATFQFAAHRARAVLPLVQTAHRCMHHVFFDKAESSPASSLFAELALYNLLASIYSSHASPIDPNAVASHDSHWPVLTSYIEGHIADTELSVQSVADVLRVSSRWVHRLFKMRSLQFGSYVRERRLQLAKDALEDPRLMNIDIKDIAASCGFQNVSHFVRRFHERFGSPPAQYRKSAMEPNALG